MLFKPLIWGSCVLMLLTATHARAAETEIGKSVAMNGMEIGAVYLQPVIMDPMMPGMNSGSDVHLEADIHAQKGNPNGFGPGDWIPYLGITYRLQKLDTSWETSGAFMPMVANDGPHYGANVKLDGPGKYRLTYRIMPPPYQGFYRHTDKETGVAAWWSPFDVSWEFAYVGTGKKGGY
ncbi:MAG: iron transporter [Alphaproteobacteria bacterium]|nr:iron transporter [Alphaproteobacteria bacterium]